MNLKIVFVFITASLAIKIKDPVNAMDAKVNGMQLDNEADMWKQLFSADSKDLDDGELI